MKIKLDYVTNSSSTSVVIWGLEGEQSFIKEFDEINIGITLDYDEKDDIVYKLHEKAKEIGVDFEYSHECEWAYIGLSPEKMNEDETLREFKIRAAKAVSEFLGEDVTPQKLKFIAEEVQT